ncbi:unnamed protein product [Urochloa decumbens]|uniref:Uncharacterized protein n=1 Tax=Urochloa decumbens TaxID=240449 RepID=A0ABC9E7J1_9POAL
MAAGDDGGCTFNQQCFCRWRSRCSPRVPLVAPGRDYEFMPADAAAAWSSVLVGVLSMTSAGNTLLRLHRFHAARSGRVLGRSGGALEIVGDVFAGHGGTDDDAAAAHVSGVTATPGPDGGRSFCLFIKETRLADLKRIAPPRPLQLRLEDLAGGAGAGDRRGIAAVSPLPDLPPELESFMPTRPIAAAGDLWAPYLTKHYGPSRLVMLRLDSDAGAWAEVAAADLPEKTRLSRGCLLAGRVLHGYAVVGGGTILLSLLPSLQPDHLFFAFDCATRTLAAVATTEAMKFRYTPIHGRGVYVEEDDTIYFLSGIFLRAYKLCRDHQGEYRMALPTKVDSLCPFGAEGYGFLTHLGDRVMCAAWISVDLPCNCDAMHVVITTFRVDGNGGGSSGEPFVPTGVQILHSTCRQLDVSPGKPIESSFEFCFLQEYEESNLETTIALKGMEAATSSTFVEPFTILACCRSKILNGLVHSRSIMLYNDSAIQMNKVVYIVCQVASRSSVFKIDILDGRLACHDKALTPLCTMGTLRYDDDGSDLMNQPLPWHFVHSGEYIYAVPRLESEVFEFNLHQGTLNVVPEKRPVDAKISIALVLEVAGRIIALSDTLQSVYYLSRTYKWMHCCTYGLPDLERKVTLSGFVVLSNNSFMVSDADTSCCFLLDLQMGRWSAVLPFEERIRSLQCGMELLPSSCSGTGFLSGKSVFVDGFIYTCIDEGIAAYEVIEEGDRYYLGNQIDLKFSWHIYWESDRMCLDCVGKDKTSSAITLCVVQANII